MLTITALTLPTRIGSGPENSSSTNIWFQTHPLLARLSNLCPSPRPLATAADPPVCVLLDWPMIGVIDTQGTQVIHTSSKDIHRSMSISSDRFGILSLCVLFFVCLFYETLLSRSLASSSSLQINSSFLDNKKRLLVSSLNGRACIHGVIKVTCMAWHASIAVGEGVRRTAQHPFGVIPRGRPVREQSQFVSCLLVLWGVVRRWGRKREAGVRKWSQINIWTNQRRQPEWAIEETSVSKESKKIKKGFKKTRKFSF